MSLALAAGAPPVGQVAFNPLSPQARGLVVAVSTVVAPGSVSSLYDVGPRRRHASLVNVDTTDWGVAGPLHAPSLAFDRTSNAHADLDAVADKVSGEVGAVAFWCRLTSGGGDGELHPFVEWGDSGNGGRFIGFRKASNDNVIFRFRRSASNVDVAIATGATFQAGGWQLLGASWDGASIKAYLNGGLVGTQSIAGGITTAFDQFRLARGAQAGAESYHANIELVHCLAWNRVLADGEMRALYDPRTRWDLYRLPWPRPPGAKAPAAGASYDHATDHGGPSLTHDVTGAVAFAGTLAGGTPNLAQAAIGTAAFASTLEVADVAPGLGLADALVGGSGDTFAHHSDHGAASLDLGLRASLSPFTWTEAAAADGTWSDADAPDGVWTDADAETATWTDE